MTTLLAVGTIAIGIAYVGLGILSAVEVLVLRSVRGVSRFGIGFALMAASCGPHHLLHGWNILGGMDGGSLLAVTTVIGLPSGLVFVALRIEAMMGGRGDRFISGTPWWLVAIPAAFVMTTGVLVDRALSEPKPSPSGMADMPPMPGMTHTAMTESHGIDVLSVPFLTNAFVVITYGLVGWFLLRTQVRRRPVAGGWSLSGLALSGVFPTCALMHLVYALTARGTTHTGAFDLLGVPASIYFLWVVHRIYREAIVDWNRRPIVGNPSQPDRPSPWGARA